jgi:hypothetical protein
VRARRLLNRIVPLRDVQGPSPPARRQGGTRAPLEAWNPRGTFGPLIAGGGERLETARDVLALIEAQVGAVLADGELGTTERARTVATLAGLALRAIESGDLAARLEALERHLSGRAA